MTLPQETIDRIEKEAEHHANIEWSEKAKHITLAQSLNWANSKEDYQSGATEWAGKVQPVIDIAKEIAMLYDPARGHVLMPTEIINRLRIALAKYKEVTNG
jgi:hypothetical protein